MPYSLVAWITNQMHLAQTLIVLTALVWWHAVRAKALVWWLPLLLFGVASFMVKEDGVMLLPAILDGPRDHARGGRTRPSAGAMGLRSPVGRAHRRALAWRSTALGELGGYGRPTMHAAWVNYSRGLTGVFGLVPADRPWQPLASWFAALLPIVAIAAWRWISGGARACLLAGIAIAALFNVPFVFVTKAEQMYLVGIGAALMLAGASVALLDLAARTRARLAATPAVAVVLGAGLASFVAVTRDITRDFEPFGPIVLSHDDIVRTWGPVPPELREYVARKREPNAATRVSSNPLDELSQVTFGVHGRETSPTAWATCGCQGRGPKFTWPQARAPSRSRCGTRSSRFASPRAPSSSPTAGSSTISHWPRLNGGCRRCRCDPSTCRESAGCIAFASPSITPGGRRR